MNAKKKLRKIWIEQAEEEEEAAKSDYKLQRNCEKPIKWEAGALIYSFFPITAQAQMTLCWRVDELIVL